MRKRIFPCFGLRLHHAFHMVLLVCECTLPTKLIASSCWLLGIQAARYLIPVAQESGKLGHVIPVVFILLFWPSIEVVRNRSIVQHREVPQVWETGGNFLNENRKIGDIVSVHPQGLQVRHRRENNMWTKFVTVQDKSREICQSTERAKVTESVREKKTSKRNKHIWQLSVRMT